MQLRIKTKLSLGLAFLFAVILLIGSIGAVYIHQISDESREILKDNYESVEYAKTMIRFSDAFVPGQTTPAIFEQALKQQEANVTEPGERELTARVRKEFELLKAGNAPEHQRIRLREALVQVMDLNLQAIVNKSNQAQHSGNRGLSIIGIIGGICFLVVFTFIINFPGYIADPIRSLTDSIKEIANKNYKQQLHFTSRDEFGELATAFNAMAEKLDHYESSNLAKILFEKKRIETIINTMNDAVIGLSEKQVLLFANPQATKLLGLSEQELVGKTAPDLAQTNDLMRLLIQPQASIEPIKIVCDRKENYFTRETLAIDSEGKAIGQVILLKNVTRFQELDMAKTNFIATISHELKTPISSIKMGLQLLGDARVGPMNDEQKGLVDGIRDDSNRLLKITGELLNMAQIETGNIQLNIQATDPAQMIGYALEATKVQAAQRHIHIDTQYDTSRKVYADAEKTAWVLINLLSNAIRYSPEHSNIRITVSEQGPQLRFAVQDQGMGIASEYTERIFDKFFQAPGGRKDGTGLGLAISKEFITAQGGTIGATSELGKGTEMAFVLPTAP